MSDMSELAPIIIDGWVRVHGIARTEAIIEDGLRDKRRQHTAWVQLSNAFESWKDDHAFTDGYARSRKVAASEGPVASYRTLQHDWFRLFERDWQKYLTLNIDWEQ